MFGTVTVQAPALSRQVLSTDYSLTGPDLADAVIKNDMGSATSKFTSWNQAQVTTTAASMLTPDGGQPSVGQPRHGSGSIGRRPGPRRGIGSTQRAISTASLGTVRCTNQSFCWGSLTTHQDVENTVPRSSRNGARGTYTHPHSLRIFQFSHGDKANGNTPDGFVPTSIHSLPYNLLRFTYWES